jgi:hypothetical protein
MHYLLILWVVGSLIAGWVGRKRRIGFWGTLLLSLAISPVLLFAIMILTHPSKVIED